jgi:hypothetical protein
MLYLIDRDEPAKARKYAAKAGDKKMMAKLDLVAKAVDSLDHEQAGGLGEWYRDLAADADDQAKAAMLRRSEGYLARALNTATEGIQQVRARVLLDTVRRELAKAEQTAPARPTRTTTRRTAKWKVIFQSDDPSIWLTKSDRSLAYEDVPADMKYLRLTRGDTNHSVIVKLTKKELRQGEPDGRPQFGWRGDNYFNWNARSLGIWHMKHDRPVKGEIIVKHHWPKCGGWGFGVVGFVNDTQGYTWDGMKLGKTVFQIAVTSEALDAGEARLLIR